MFIIKQEKNEGTDAGLMSEKGMVLLVNGKEYAPWSEKEFPSCDENDKARVLVETALLLLDNTEDDGLW